MPKVPSYSLNNSQAICERALSQTNISAKDLSSIFSDALVSFSPLATLVGAKSARALARRTTNLTQSVAASLAPVGALGMMATVIRGADLPGIKEMLGVGGDDIRDAARALGCAAVLDGVLPMMDDKGSLISILTGAGLENAACAVVRQEWTAAAGVALRRAPNEFVGATLIGRIAWARSSPQAARETIEDIKRELSSPSVIASDIVFDKIGCLGGRGILELQWPAPAMSLKTGSVVVIIYIIAFAASFVLVVSLAASRYLPWPQQPLPSALLVGGQTVLMLGHVAAQFAVRSQREIRNINVPTQGLDREWMLIDKSSHPTAVARRPLRATGRPARVTLSQCYCFRRQYVTTWHAVLTLLALAGGFVAFYIGGKASDVRTVAIYICLFFLANATKGPLIQFANKPRYTRLPHFGHESEQLPSTLERRAGIPPASQDQPPHLPKESGNGKFRIYTKVSIRDRSAADIFFFSGSEEWALAAHVIYSAVTSIVSLADFGPGDEPGDLLQIPLYQYQWDGTATCNGIFLLSISQTRLEHLFWDVGMEMVSILMGSFDSCTTLCSESAQTSAPFCLASLVYACTRMLLSEHVYCGDELLPCKQRGAKSLMRSIEHTAKNTKNPGENMHHLLTALTDAARAAKCAKGAKTMSKMMTLIEDGRFMKMVNGSRIAELQTVQALQGQLHNVAHVVQLEEWGMMDIQEIREAVLLVADPKHGPLVPELQEKSAELLDSLQAMHPKRSPPAAHFHQMILRDEELEDLKSDVRELPPLHTTMVTERTVRLEILRGRARHLNATLQQDKNGVYPSREALRRDLDAFIIQHSVALQVREEKLREDLRKEGRALAQGNREGEDAPLFGPAEHNQLNGVREAIRRLETTKVWELEEPEAHEIRLRQLYLEQDRLLTLRQLSHPDLMDEK